MDDKEYDLYKKIALLEVQNTELKSQLSELKEDKNDHLTNEVYEKAKRKLYTSIGGVLVVFTLFGVVSINQIINEIEKQILEAGTSRVVEKVAEKIRPKIEANTVELVNASVERKVREDLVTAFENVQKSIPESASSEIQSSNYVQAIEKTYEANLYWVIAASSVQRKDVESELERVKSLKGEDVFNNEFPDAEITLPYPGTNHYPLVLGTALPYKEANNLRLKAIEYGFRDDTFLWNDK